VPGSVRLSGFRLAALAACGLIYAISLFLITLPGRVSGAGGAALIASGCAIVWMVLKWLVVPWMELPRVEDVKVLDSSTVCYPTALSIRQLVYPLCGPVFTTILWLPFLIVALSCRDYATFSRLLFIFLAVPGGYAAGPIVSTLASLPLIVPLRIEPDRGVVRVRVLSWLRCEAELITDGEVEAPGFRELGRYPVEYRGLPARPGDVEILIGHFRPGVRGVEVRGCRFLFLRTRGFCLLYGARGLPGDREEAFRLARWWERFSMVYAALCLRRDGVPDPEEVKRRLNRVENNRSSKDLVTYMGCDWRPNIVDMTLGYLGASNLSFCAVGFLFCAMVAFLGLGTYLRNHPIGAFGLFALMHFSVCLMVAIRVMRHQVWLVKSGSIYEAVLRGSVPGERRVMRYLDKLYRWNRWAPGKHLPRWPYDDRRSGRK